MLLTGSIFYGVSTSMLFTSSDFAGFLLYGGLTFIFLGITTLALMLPGIIVFFILSAVIKDSKKTMKIKTADRSLAFCVGL